MKTQLLIIASVTAFIFMGASCHSAPLDKLYDTKVEPGAIIGNKIVLTTNDVLTLAFTNATGEVTPPKIERVITPVITAIYAAPVTNLVPRPAVEAGIAAAGAIPIPWAAPVALLLGWLYSAYSAFRNKKTSKALVTGIEAGRLFLNQTPEGQKLDAVFKDKLIEHQELAGVLDKVSKLINEHTGNTVK